MLLNKKVITLIIGSLILLPQFAFSSEVNILSERQEFLLRPFLDVFEEKSGIKANVLFISKKDLWSV